MARLWASMRAILADIRTLVVTTIVSSLFLNSGLPIDFWQRKLSISVNLSYLNLLIIFLCVAVAFAGFLVLAVIKLRKYRILSGREASMAANCELIEKFGTDSSIEIRSTRVTHWRVSENSKGRQTFRNLLTEKITNSFPVRRLWQIKDADELAQLRRYLKQYEPYDNYSVKVIVARHVWIPEILVVGQKVASMSFPEPSSPRELGRALHFFGRQEVDTVARYFDILWDTAIPIKISSQIFDTNLENIEEFFRAPPPYLKQRRPGA
ncbi:MAG: hypothetical protein ACREC0_15075 [Methylocella sp.]